MILLDNSEYMRNGDYIPTRLEAQHDAANLLVNAKTQSNPESTVGVIAMSGTTGSGPGQGGTGAELLVSPTDDMGKILAALHGVPTRGPGDSASSGVDIPASVQVASLALKHRRNKNGAQRVVVFVGSPLDASIEPRTLQRAGRQLKKNNVAIDVICMGEHETNEGRLQELVDAANGTGDGGERTCNLVTIPAGVLPSDVLVSSPIIGGGGRGGGGMPGSPGGAAAGGGGGGADAFAEYGGVDPNMDPELAMALRVSMEEERARQERVAAAAAEEAAAQGGAGGAEESKDGEEAKQEGMEVDADGKPAADAAAPAAAPSGGADAMAASAMMGGADDEDALLQQALAMSMAESYAPPAAAAAEEGATKTEEDEAKPSAAAPAEATPMEMDEDAEMAMALAMSMQQDGGGGGGGAEFQDPAFVNQVSSLVGIFQS